MGAPQNAKPLGCKGWIDKVTGEEMPEDKVRKVMPGVHCDGCGWRGSVVDLLEDPDDSDPRSTMWCPQCGSTGWIYD